MKLSCSLIRNNIEQVGPQQISGGSARASRAAVDASSTTAARATARGENDARWRASSRPRGRGRGHAKARVLPAALGVGLLALVAVGCRKQDTTSAKNTNTNMNMSMPGMNMAMSGTNHSMSGMNMSGMKMSTNGTNESMAGMDMTGMGTNQSMPGMDMSSMSNTNTSMSGMNMPMPAANENAAANAGVPNRVPVDLDQEQQQFIDIRTQPVTPGDAVVTIRAVGIIAYNQAGLNNINTRIMGWAEKLYVDKPGQFVEKGAPLMDLYSPDLYSAEDEYLLAYRQVQRFKHVPPQDVAETHNVVWRDSAREAQELLRSARKRLELWQISRADIAAIQKSGHATTTLPIRAPFSGYVIQKHIDPAQMVKPGQTLYVLADLSAVWINAQIYEYEQPYVKVGQDVRITATAHPGKVYHAKVDFIYPYSENQTRTTTARLVMKNPDGLFKPNDYVNAVIQVNEGEHLLIPSSAVYDTGVTQYVFVETASGHFVPRRIELGAHVNGDQVVVSQGLTKGEKIVTDGNFLLDSESQLRAASVNGGN